MHKWRRVRRYWIYQCYALVWHFPETSGLCYSVLCASLSRDVQFLPVRGPISWNFFLNFLPNSLKHTQACFGLGCVKKKRKEKCSHTYPAHLLDCRLILCLGFFLSSACTSQFLTHLNWNMYIWCDMVYSDFRCLSESSASDRNWFVVLSYQYREWPRFKIQPWNVFRPGNLHPVTNIFCAWVDPVCFCSKNQAQPTPAFEPERFSLQNLCNKMR